MQKILLFIHNILSELCNFLYDKIYKKAEITPEINGKRVFKNNKAVRCYMIQFDEKISPSVLFNEKLPVGLIYTVDEKLFWKDEIKDAKSY